MSDFMTGIDGTFLLRLGRMEIHKTPKSGGIAVS